VKAAWKILRLERSVVWIHSTSLAVFLYPFVRIRGHRLMVTTHGLWGLTPVPTTNRLTWLRNRVVEGLFFRIAKIDLVTTVDPYSQRVLIRYQPRVVYVPSGVDFDATLFRSIEPGAKEDAALFLGRHVRQKNLELITRIAKSGSLKLYIAGSGPLTRRYLEKWAGMSKVTYIDGISDEEKGGYLKRVRFLLQPSLWEGFPLTILEALARKTVPIIRDYAELKTTDLSEFLVVIDEGNYEERIQGARNASYDWGKLERLLSTRYAWQWIVEQYDGLLSSLAA